MHKVHGNASSWDVMNCGKPQCLSVFHRIPASQQSHQLISLPSPLTPHLYFMFSCPVELLLTKQVAALFPWGHFCPLLQSGDSLEWMPSHPGCETLEWFLPYLAPEESQSKQCPIISSHPCSNFYGFVTKLCCSHLGCTSSPLLIRGWELMLHSRCCKRLSCSEWSLNLFEWGPESFGSP